MSYLTLDSTSCSYLSSLDLIYCWYFVRFLFKWCRSRWFVSPLYIETATGSAEVTIKPYLTRAESTCSLSLAKSTNLPNWAAILWSMLTYQAVNERQWQYLRAEYCLSIPCWVYVTVIQFKDYHHCNHLLALRITHLNVCTANLCKGSALS